MSDCCRLPFDEVASSSTWLGGYESKNNVGRKWSIDEAIEIKSSIWDSKWSTGFKDEKIEWVSQKHHHFRQLSRTAQTKMLFGPADFSCNCRKLRKQTAKFACSILSRTLCVPNNV